MKEKLSAFWNGFKDKVSALGRTVKILIVTGLAVVIVGAVVLTLVLNHTDYTTLYTGLNDEEVSQVVTAINNFGVSDVRLGANGSISVPDKVADNLRMQLSMQGYPSSAFNFDVWKEGIGIWATDTEKRVLQIQQLQTHLMKAINTISAVKNSYVIITLPKVDNYVISSIDNDEDEPRVSVKLDLRAGVTLSTDQIEGIYALILNSLPGLKRDYITVTGTDGELLSPELSGSEEAMSLYTSRLNFQKQMEKLLESQLDPTMKKLYKDYTINVSVALDFNDEKVEQTIYTPTIAEDGTLGGMVSSTTKAEGWGGIGSLSGVVGTTGNSDISPNYPTITGDGDNEYYYQNSITTNRLVNTEIRQLEKSGYSVSRITAAVTVDEVNMLEAQKETLREVVAFAIGTDIGNVTVANYPFVINVGTGDGNHSIINSTNNDWIYLLIVSMGLLVLILLIIAILTGSARKKKRAKAKAKATAQAAVAQAAAAESIAIHPVDDEPEFNIQKLDDDTVETKGVILRREIKDFSHGNPDVVAQLLRTLMRDEN